MSLDKFSDRELLIYSALKGFVKDALDPGEQVGIISTLVGGVRMPLVAIINKETGSCSPLALIPDNESLHVIMEMDGATRMFDPDADTASSSH